MKHSTKIFTLLAMLIVSTNVFAKGPRFSQGSFSKGGFSKSRAFGAPSAPRRGFTSPHGSAGLSGRSGSAPATRKPPIARPISRQQISHPISTRKFTSIKPSLSRPVLPSTQIRPTKIGGTFRPSATHRIPNAKPNFPKPVFKPRSPAKLRYPKPSRKPSNPVARPENLSPGKLPGLTLKLPISKTPLLVNPIGKPSVSKPGKLSPKPEFAKLPGIEVGKRPGFDLGAKPSKPEPSNSQRPNDGPAVAPDQGDDGHGLHLNITIGRPPICLPPVGHCPLPRACPPCVLAICPHAEVIVVEQTPEQVLIEFLEEPSEPAFVIDLHVDTEVSLEVDGLSEIPGALILDVNGIGLPVEILGSEENLVSIKVPSVGLSEVHVGKLYVLNLDSQLVAAVDARLHPASR